MGSRNRTAKRSITPIAGLILNGLSKANDGGNDMKCYEYCSLDVSKIDFDSMSKLIDKFEKSGWEIVPAVGTVDSTDSLKIGLRRRIDRRRIAANE